MTLAELILDITRSKSKIVFKPLPEDDPKKRKPDISLAKKELNGWQPKIQINEGLLLTIDYFKHLLKKT